MAAGVGAVAKLIAKNLVHDGSRYPLRIDGRFGP
jgi:hypothetical protein